MDDYLWEITLIDYMPVQGVSIPMMIEKFNRELIMEITKYANAHTKS